MINKLYYSDLCPDTVPFVTELKRIGLPFEEVNITASMANLKEFLSLRDHQTHFEQAKQNGYVGIPVLLLPDGRLVSDLSEL